MAQTNFAAEIDCPGCETGKVWPDTTPEVPSVRVRVAPGEASPVEAATIDVVASEGEDVQIADGLVLTIDRLTSYARLSVVDDRSVYVIYALFALAVIGLTFAVFAPLRGARALVVDGDNGMCLHVTARHSRGDPHFPARVESALSRALGVEEEV